jgi:hypothetical protein
MGKSKNYFKSREEEMFVDPFETLIKIQGKKTLISKMESIPVIQDKKYVNKEKESIDFLK